MGRRAESKKRCSRASWESTTKGTSAASPPLGALPVPAEATDSMAPTRRASAELQVQLTAQARGGGRGREAGHLAKLVARVRALSIALARGPHGFIGA